MDFKVSHSTITGSTTVPTSKSHTMRSILFASMAKKTSIIKNPLPSPDTTAMIDACNAIGASIISSGSSLEVKGTGGELKVPEQVIDVGNSGQVLRFIAAFAATINNYTILTGDKSIRSIRPMGPLLSALTQAGAFAESSKGDEHAPIIIRGPINQFSVSLSGQDSQPVSALLMLAPFIDGTSHIKVLNAGELPWIDLTLYWLDKLGVKYTNDSYEYYTVEGKISYDSLDYTVPGDWSSAAFPIAAALVCNQDLIIENMDYSDPQGDKYIIDILKNMGANIIIDDSNKKIIIKKHSGLKGIDVDVNKVIDAVPILATIACFASSPTTITGAGIARHKECDRLHAIATELNKMGGKIEELSDGLIITPSTLHGALVDSWHDHRIAMSLAIAGLTTSETIISNVLCVDKSFPGFSLTMRSIGANIETINNL